MAYDLNTENTLHVTRTCHREQSGPDMFLEVQYENPATKVTAPPCQMGSRVGS